MFHPSFRLFCIEYIEIRRCKYKAKYKKHVTRPTKILPKEIFLAPQVLLVIMTLTDCNIDARNLQEFHTFLSKLQRGNGSFD